MFVCGCVCVCVCVYVCVCVCVCERERERERERGISSQIEMDLSELQMDQRYKTWYRLQHSDHQKGKDKK